MGRRACYSEVLRWGETPSARFRGPGSACRRYGALHQAGQKVVIRPRRRLCWAKIGLLPLSSTEAELCRAGGPATTEALISVLLQT